MIGRQLSGAALAALVLFAAGCGGDDSGAPSGADSAGGVASATSSLGGGEASGTTEGQGGDAAAATGDNPCGVVSQQQWEQLFGSGVKKSEASGGADNCNVLTSGSSPGHEISFVNFTANLSNTTFDAQVGFNPPCGSAPAAALAGVGDKAVLDTSCLAISGRAWVIAEVDGDVVGLFYNAGEPAKAEPATVASTLTTIAKDALAAR